MQVLQSFAGAFSIYLCIQIGRHLKFSYYWIIFSTCCIGFSYGFWAYSVEADTYVLPIVFILLAVNQLFKVTSEEWSNSCLLKIGLYLSIATLIYQQHILLFLPFLITLISIQKNTQTINFSTFTQKIVLVCAFSVALTVGTYLSIAFLNPNIGEINSLYDAILWSLGHGQQGLYSEFSLASFVHSLIGFGKGIWGTSFLFGFEWFQELVLLLLPQAMVLEETYLSMSLTALSKYTSLVFLVTGLIGFLGCFCLIAINYFVERKNLLEEPYAVFSLSMFFVYGIFNTMYFPDNLEFWIATIPIFFIFLTYLLNQISRYEGLSRAFSITVILGLLIPNALGSIVPQTMEKGDFWREHTTFFIEQLSPDDVVIVNCGYGCSTRLKWWSRAQVHHLGELTGSEVEDLFTSSGKNRTFISSWTWAPPKGFIPAKWGLDKKELELAVEFIHQSRSLMKFIYKDDTQEIYQISSNLSSDSDN
jgi:hypothetical protein